MLFLYLIFFLFFYFLSWKNFRLALGVFIIFLPTYLIRFNIGPLPTTVLEFAFGALFFVWLIKHSREDWPVIKNKIATNKWLFVFLALFFAGSVAGIFISDMWWASLGQWRAYFLEPILLFFILLGRTTVSTVIPVSSCHPGPGSGIQSRRQHLDSRFHGNDIGGKVVVWFLLLSTVSVSVVAIIQKITGQFYPPSLWDDQLFGRVTSFFTTPNAIGLYFVPVVALWAVLPIK